MKKKRVSEFLTEEEAKALLRVPDRRSLQGKRDYALLLLMLSTGLRKAEVCGLRDGNIGTYRNQAVVDVIGKGGKYRRVALNPDVVEAVKDYRKALKSRSQNSEFRSQGKKDGEACPGFVSGKKTKNEHGKRTRSIAQPSIVNGQSEGEFLFYTTGERGNCWPAPLTSKAVDCLIRRVSKAALVQKRITPHTTRHTFATTLLDKGADLKTVQELLGHGHIRTTERYLHTSDEKKMDAVSRLQFI